MLQDLRKFQDLMASEELYFRRADLFTDKSEETPGRKSLPVQTRSTEPARAATSAKRLARRAGLHAQQITTIEIVLADHDPKVLYSEFIERLSAQGGTAR